MNEALTRLEPYPFEKLAALRSEISPRADRAPIDLSIGEPRHPTPAVVLEALVAHVGEAARYPKTRGTGELREGIVAWLGRRYPPLAGVLDPEHHVLPVNGTREALFAIAQCVVDRTRPDATVVLPNPCYQIYEGATLLAGARPHYLPCLPGRGYRPDYAAVPGEVWDRTQLVYLCSPGNPTGAVTPEEELEALIALAERHDFVIAADECYCEIYPDEQAPPPGLLEIAARGVRPGLERCLAFHSLSKRSNAPGMRSGFVAGDPALIADFLRYRTYHGGAMAPFVQAASRAAWADEVHVRDNREHYRRKFDAVLEVLAPVLDVDRPQGAFYLWPRVPVDDVDFARGLLEAENVCTLPGRFLGRGDGDANPGAGHVRIALVDALETCVEAARRIRGYVQRL